MNENKLFDLSLLKERIAVLGLFHKVAFAAVCAERLFPNYVKFNNEERWGDPVLLRRILDWVWSAVELKLIDRRLLDIHLDGFESLLPETEDFKSCYTSAALDAASAIYEALKCCEDNDVIHVLNAASSARDAVYMAVASRMIDAGEEPDEILISSHPAFVEEMERQRADLVFLESNNDLNTEFLLKFRYQVSGRFLL